MQIDFTRWSELSPDLTTAVGYLTKVVGTGLIYNIASWTFGRRLKFKFLGLITGDKPLFTEIERFQHFYVISDCFQGI